MSLGIGSLMWFNGCIFVFQANETLLKNGGVFFFVCFPPIAKLEDFYNVGCFD